MRVFCVVLTCLLLVENVVKHLIISWASRSQGDPGTLCLLYMIEERKQALYNGEGDTFVSASGALLKIIAQLQHQHSTAYGRRLLLDHARKSAGARLALLLRYDETSQQLLPVEQRGTLPRDASSRPLPIHGLFGNALHTPNPRQFTDIADDPRSLPEERALTWRDGNVLLCQIGSGQGVMVLCSGPKTSIDAISNEAEQELIICASLLASYLVDAPGDTGAENLPDNRDTPSGTDGENQDTHKEPPSTSHLPLSLQHPSPETVYEFWLLASSSLDEQTWYHDILRHISDSNEIDGGQLWLYRPSQARFSRVASIGEISEASLALISLHVEETAAQQQKKAVDYGIHIVSCAAKEMLVACPLVCAGQLVGAAAFTLHCQGELPVSQRLFLEEVCRAAAFLLHNRQMRLAERQAAIDQERGRIARDLHDSVAQSLAHLLHKLEYIQRIAGRQPQQAQRELDLARATLLESLKELRRGISSLLPAPLETQSFDDALGQLLDEFSSSEPGIMLTFDKGKRKRLPPSLEAPIYRLMQEALQNVRKHARATQVSTQIQEHAGLLVVQIHDNGVGFVVEQARSAGSVGLRSMQERVEQAGGRLEISSKPGAGTTIKARFPLHTSAAALTPREREVLRLLAEGATNRVIADELSVSAETIKSHVRNIMQKLHVKDRTQAAVIAARQQWV